MIGQVHAESGCTWTRRSEWGDTWTRNADGAEVEGTAADALSYDAAHPTLFHRLHGLLMAELREEGVRASTNAVIGLLKANGSTYTRYYRGERRAPHWVVQGYAEAWAATGRKRYAVTATVSTAGQPATPEQPIPLSGELEGMQISGVVLGPDGLPGRIELRICRADATEYRTLALPSAVAPRGP